MKLHKWLKHLGEGCCEIECEDCKDIDNKFYHNTKESFNHGLVVCPKCGNQKHPKDVVGLYFLLTEDGANYECGNCGAKFIFHDGDTEATAQCPACGWFKPTNETTQEIIAEEQG
jgi:DNA-directed RNA polymerase subunit RPC12/RpoP